MTGDMSQNWLPIVNDSGEIIPANSLVRATGVDAATGFLSVAKPTTDGDPRVLIVGATQVPVGGRSVATYDLRHEIAYEQDDGEPAAGETWGAAVGSWTARKNKAGFTILGGAVNGVVNALRDFTTNPTESSSSGSGGGGSVTVVSDTTCDGSLLVTRQTLSGYVTIGGRRYPITLNLG
jgi:hypothetical protein